MTTSVRRLMIIAFMVTTSASIAGAENPAPEDVKNAIARALPLIEASTKEYPHHRDCFSCHHQAVPLLALSLGRKRGFTVDGDNVQEQLELTHSFLANASEAYRKGIGQGGGVTTAGYALWTLETAQWKPDEVTAAVADFLLQSHEGSDHWSPVAKRPPSEGSDFTSTFVALRGLRTFGTTEQRDRIAKRAAKAKSWLLASPGKDTEDRVFRLRALPLADADKNDVSSAAETLRAAQRPDGGWSQLDEGESDAYATGSVLVALHQVVGLPADDPAYRRGLAFLIRTQRPDGSWYVKSRSKPFQTYFESGFPHGNDQFISIAASAWATSALLLAVPK
jgi:hypothetical protein